MVAETFISNPENKPEVNHKDGNKHNNDVSNLEWCTRKENAKHAYSHGLFGLGENFSVSSISNSQCKQICELLSTTDIPIKEIAYNVNCTSKIVEDILHRRTWTHISNNYDFSNRKISSYIDEDTAISICELLENSPLSAKEISEIVECKVHHVKDIKRGKTWRNISKNYNF